MPRAIEDVGNAYGTKHKLDRRAAATATAISDARRNQKAAVGLYEGGANTFEDVLSAQLGVFERDDGLIQTQMGQAAATVQLYRALGGGW